ncbi:MAG: YihY/virulence factor BrkB family protein [Eubacteriales bacterium]|nr:YihY/virulence factor BrkB family protein [Sarcina sp.]MBR2729934.1 YihY/virulence factor BrkB family protein [Lachnospiraceae bacterium]MDO4417323.1 YihY/virulence factor BrkB family protein [Eubacteriales bacterium]
MRSFIKKEEIIPLLKRTVEVYTKHEMGIYAGNATYYLLISFVPFLMMIISIINILPWFSIDDISNFLMKVVPDIPQLRTAIVSIIKNLNRQSGTIVIYAFAFTCLWSGSHGVSALMAGLEKINHTQRNYFLDKPKAIIYSILFSLLIPSMLFFQMLRAPIKDLVTRIFTFLSLQQIGHRINQILRFSGIITIAAMTLIIVMTFTFLPAGKRKIIHQLPGSVLTSVLWVVFTNAFGYFITRFWKLSTVYGTLAAVFLASMWLRFIITFLFYGASLNRAIQVKISRECST